MREVTCSLLGQPYFLDELEHEETNNNATIAATGSTRRSVENFCIISYL